ncbi:hypothetical protein FO519_003876 [Halicephalobus sp. NKZ332]|nr:hypothetical protein FO519_003876 [Halicephalobus sp. NKZ332]
MTQYFSKEQINEFRQCFNLYASDGFVTNDAQLRYITRSLGYSPTVPETKTYIKNSGSTVDFAKFLEILHQEEKKSLPSVEISTALNNLDTSNKGYISRSELFTLLTNFGEKMGKEEASMVLKAMKIKSDIIPIPKIIQHMK